MEWYQVLIIMFSTFAIGLLVYISLSNKLDSIQEDLENQRTYFHGRLFALSEKYMQTKPKSTILKKEPVKEVKRKVGRPRKEK